MLKRLNGWFPLMAGIILILGTVWCWSRYATTVEKNVEMLTKKHNSDIMLVTARHEEGMKYVSREIKVLRDEQQIMQADVKDILREVKK